MYRAMAMAAFERAYQLAPWTPTAGWLPRSEPPQRVAPSREELPDNFWVDDGPAADNRDDGVGEIGDVADSILEQVADRGPVAG